MSGADRMMGSKVIRVLEERGLLVWRPDPADARVLRIEMTAAGMELARKGGADRGRHRSADLR